MVSILSRLNLALLVALPAGSAVAAETWIPPLRVGDDNTWVQLYGQINPGFLVVDDGDSTLGYGPVDNGNSSTRFGVRLYVGIANGTFLGANYEAQYDPYSTNYVNQLNRGEPDWDRYLTRKAEGYLNSEQFGVLWVGQGSMASDGTAEVDLSGTDVIGYSSISDFAGGQLFAFSRDGGLSAISVGSAFSNFDGLGRKVRVRYDTPTLAGFTLSGSYGREMIPEDTGIDVWDVALRYAGEFGGFKVASAVAYSDTGSADRYDGSVSVLHLPTGISVTGAAGYDARDDGVNAQYLYGKLGYQRSFFDVGATAFAVDVYSGDDIHTAGSESFSWGAFVVQNFDYYQSQVYLGVRSYQFDNDDGSYDPLLAALTGVRVKF